MNFRVLSPSEQAAAYLRTKLMSGDFDGFLPGEGRLAQSMGVGRDTVRAAVELLENEGFLVSQGAGKKRRIVLPGDAPRRCLKVRILPYSESDRLSFRHVSLMHRIRDEGYEVESVASTVMGLIRKPHGIHRMLSKSDADAWVVTGGSVDILHEFAERSIPAFAYLGRMRGIPIAGVKPDKVKAHLDSLKRLIELGHRRIVRLVLQERVLPSPGKVEREFLKMLESSGIPTGPYNLPIWDGTIAGFNRKLHSVFRHSPPTALILDTPILFFKTQHHLARHGILAPRDVSLICGDPDPYFSWQDPKPAHLHWALEDLFKELTRWLANIAGNKDDKRQRFTRAVFVEGGTIGPATSSPCTLPPI